MTATWDGVPTGTGVWHPDPVTWAQVDRGELLGRSGEDPWVRWTTTGEVLAVAGEDGWACVGPWRPGGAHWGRPLEVPDGYQESGSGRWDFLWTRELPDPPGPPAAVAPVELDDVRHAEEIERFGRGHNPDFEGFPGRGLASLWLGARDRAGSLVAVGAVHDLASGIPHLAGIVVEPACRRSGLGRWLTAELTARAVREAGVSTLGVYSDNDAALRLYDGLGYRTAHGWHTRSLAVVDRAGTAAYD
ncbi:MAG: hypothetical protein DCC50_08225 [Acidobacteria bacterium]|nr:MAG: hypothetical protein DCC50_08225 [Acidobacteriota bacterium]